MPFIKIDKDKKIRAAVIYPEVSDKPLRVSAASRLEEACGLAAAINLDVVFSQIFKVRTIKPSTYVGQGVLDCLLAQKQEEDIELVIVDASLTPIQQRNLEKKLDIKVIDRTALILEIFGERAKTKEGKLQVELAHLTYQRSRLVRSWTHLERQRGGAGFLGGPGETQIELDRRIIDDKIIRIKKELDKVRQTRQIQRSARKRIPYRVAALVGYTNAGKSSLFNRLSQADVLAKDMLFATLDPSMRKITLPSGQSVILSDTVGFISDLPHELVMAFRATLEEVMEADIIVHVRDIAGPETREQKEDVLKVLANLGLENIHENKNYIEVLNKIDLLSSENKKELIGKRSENIIPVSAITGEGCNELLRCLDDKLAEDYQIITVEIPESDGKTLAWIYEHAEVLSKNTTENKTRLKLRIDNVSVAKLQKIFN